MKQFESRPVAAAAQRTAASGQTAGAAVQRTAVSAPVTTSAQRLAMLAAVNAQQAVANANTATRVAPPVNTQAPQPLRKIESPKSAAEKVRQALTPPTASSAQVAQRAPSAAQQMTRPTQSSAALMQAQSLLKSAAPITQPTSSRATAQPSQTGQFKQLPASAAPRTQANQQTTTQAALQAPVAAAPTEQAASRTTRRVESPLSAAERVRQALAPVAPAPTRAPAAQSQFLPENATNLPPAIAAAIAKQKAEAAALTAQRKLAAAASATVPAPTYEPSMTYPGQNTAAQQMSDSADIGRATTSNARASDARSTTVSTPSAADARVQANAPRAQQVTALSNTGTFRVQNGAQTTPASASVIAAAESNAALARAQSRPIAPAASNPALAAQARLIASKQAATAVVAKGVPTFNAAPAPRTVASKAAVAVPENKAAPVSTQAVSAPPTGVAVFRSPAPPAPAVAKRDAAQVRSQAGISSVRPPASQAAPVNAEPVLEASAEEIDALLSGKSLRTNKAAATQAPSRATRKRPSALIETTVAARKAIVAKLSNVLPRATPALMGFVASPSLPVPDSMPAPDVSRAPSTARAPVAPPAQRPSHVQDLQPESAETIDASLADLVKSNPAAFRGPRHSLLRRAVGLVVVTLTLGGAAFYQIETQGADQLSEQEEMTRQVAFAQLRDITLQTVPKSEVDLAFAQMQLVKEERDALGVLLAESAQASQSGSPLVGSSGSVRLERMILRDTNSPDGDRVAVVSAGFRQEVTLTALPQAMVVPVDDSQIIQMVGITDGSGGGITMGVRGENEEVLMPVMRKGQILSLMIVR